MSDKAAKLAAVLGLVAAGCGSSGPPASAFRQAATHICNSSSSRAARIATPGTPAAAVTFLRRGVVVLTPELLDLERLHPPRALAPDYRTALGSFTAELDALRSAVSQLERGDDPVSTTMALQQRLSPLEKTGDRAWRALELPACQSR